MKISSFLLPLALEAKEPERAFSNFPPFLTDGSERATWSKQSKNVKIYNRLAPATTKFFDEFFRYSGNVKATKFANRQVKLITDIQKDFKKQVARCDKRSGRGQTTIFDDSLTDGWTLPTNQGIKKAYQALFWQHARWAREEIYWECPIIGMRVFKRLDRLLFLTIWQYCELIDDSADVCTDTYFLNGVRKEHPRKTEWMNNYYGRYSLIAYDGNACESEDNGPQTLNMVCPEGHTISTAVAQFGRWNQNTCTKGVDKSSLEMCDKFVDVKDFVASSCDGQQTCDVSISPAVDGIVHDRNQICPGIPKYTRIRWICDPSEEFLDYGDA